MVMKNASSTAITIFKDMFTLTNLAGREERDDDEETEALYEFMWWSQEEGEQGHIYSYTPHRLPRNVEDRSERVD